jgi:hypothetical protein
MNADDYVPEGIQYRLNALPEGYSMYYRIVKTNGPKDNREVNIFGHPRGSKAKWRQASEFVLHLLWLITDDKLDPDNCKCVKCSPGGGAAKDKDSDSAGGSANQKSRKKKNSSSSTSQSQTPYPAASTGTSQTPSSVLGASVSSLRSLEPPAGQPLRSSNGQPLQTQPMFPGNTKPAQKQNLQNQQAQNGRQSTVQSVPAQGVASAQLPQSQNAQSSIISSTTPISSSNTPTTSNPATVATLNSAPSVTSSTAYGFISSTGPPVASNAGPVNSLVTAQPSQNFLADATTGSFGFESGFDGNDLIFSGLDLNSVDQTIDPGQNFYDQLSLMPSTPTPMPAPSRAANLDGTPAQPQQQQAPSFSAHIGFSPQNLQQIFDVSMRFYYRPGELVWVDRDPNKHPALAIITGRSTVEAQPTDLTHTYRVAYLGSINPLHVQQREDVATNHEDGKILPFLTLPLGGIKDPVLREGIESNSIKDENSMLHHFNVQDCVTLAAQRADRSYFLDTKLNVDEVYPFETRDFDLYKSLWLGAERIWPGDVLRVRSQANPNDHKSNNIMIITHIKETWENAFRDHTVQPNPRESPTDPSPDDLPTLGKLTVVGNIYSLQRVSNNDVPNASTLPLPLRQELERLNEFAVRGNRRQYTLVLTNNNAEIPLSQVLGRWYPFWVLFSIYDEDLFSRVFTNRSVDPPLASRHLNPRGTHILHGHRREGDEGLGRRRGVKKFNQGFDLLEAYRCALQYLTRLEPYEGSLYDPQGTRLPLSDGGQFGYDFGDNPFNWAGPTGTDRTD